MPTTAYPYAAEWNDSQSPAMSARVGGTAPGFAAMNGTIYGIQFESTQRRIEKEEHPMGDFRFPTNGQPGTPPQPPPFRDQDPNMPTGGGQAMAPPVGDVWQAPGTGAGYGGVGYPGGGPGDQMPPAPIRPAPPPQPRPIEFGGGPVRQPPREFGGGPVRQPMGPPMPQIKPQARPGGPGVAMSAGSASRGFGGGMTPPVRQPPVKQPPDPNKQPPPYPGKYPGR